jgi:hypothetical protein
MQDLASGLGAIPAFEAIERMRPLFFSIITRAAARDQ